MKIVDKGPDICPCCHRDKQEKYGKPVICKCGYDWRYPSEFVVTRKVSREELEKMYPSLRAGEINDDT